MRLAKILSTLLIFLFIIPSTFCQVFDLATTITLASGNDDRVYPGETVSFEVSVINQGTVSAENIEVTLMIPVGLTSVSGIPNLGTITFAGPLTPGSMVNQIIDFDVDAGIFNSTMLTIKSEISSAEDGSGTNPMDVDSTPDTDFGNDVTINDVIDNTGGDEDDADIEVIYAEIFDLALVKTLAPGEDNRVYPGETVTFRIEVHNQGTISANNVVWQEYVPAGLTPIGATTNTFAGPIGPGSSQSLNVTYTVTGTSAQTILSRTEIQSYEDDLGESPEDIDSVADNDPNNDTTVNDAINNESGDEDDSDLENVFLEIFDLASNITLAPGEDDIANPGETVSFKVSVFNQGTVSAENIDITLMIPPDLISLSGLTNMSTITFNGPLAPGDTANQIHDFVVNGGITSAIQLIVREEISFALDDVGENAPDFDSTPDAVFTNDAGGVVDSNTDDTINNEFGDEDDSDPENIFVELSTTVDFTSTDHPILESVNQATVCLQLSDVTPVQLIVDVSHTGGSAQAGADYVAFPVVQQIVFPVNTSADQCFTIALLDDSLIETNETIDFEITAINSSEPTAVGMNATSSITILDDDDTDNDNVENSVDNCPDNFNPLQGDLDGDGIGDVCDGSNIVTTNAEFEDHIYISSPTTGVIMKSADGQCWVTVVTNTGSLSVVSVVCPD